MLLNFLLALFFSIFVVMTSKQYVYTLQLNGYEPNFSLKDKIHFEKSNFVFLLLTVLSLITSFLCIISDRVYAVYFYWAIFGGFSVYLAFFSKSYSGKKPFKITNRIKRLFFVMFIEVLLIYFVAFSIISLICADADFISVFASILAFFVPLYFLIAVSLLEPLENYIKSCYIEKCEKTLNESSVTKIGITGSYGKTGVKNILNAMISEERNVLSTPESYNTPMGICKSVSDLKSDTEFFIAEMGARHKGDIEELMNLVKPTFGILTGINSQHIESFETQENIVNEKKKIADMLPASGTLVVNIDSPYANDIYMDYKGNKVSVSVKDKADVYADQITVTKTGSEFILHIEEESLICRTKLIGLHNVLNIAVSAAAAHKIGIKNENIINAIKFLKPVPHRMELIDANNDICIIDDSFNSNSDGFNAALDCLNLFEGRKIIVTPGIVEQGSKHYDTNYEIGKKMAKVCSYVVLIGKNRTKPIYDALIEEKFDAENIIIKNSLEEVKSEFKNILKAGDTVLIENDLPDNYDEI